jgi:FAD:protein FMN transferase
MPKRIIRFLTLALLLWGLPGRAAAQETRYEFAQVHMGMEVRLVLYARDPALARRAAGAAYRLMATLEDIMSDYRDESEVRRLAASAVRRPVSRELAAVLGHALELAEQSNGAFDPTVGPVVKLWRQARATGRRPDTAELRRAERLVGWRKVHLDTVALAIWFDTTGIQLDLGGIAKGYILDRALAELRAEGVESALLIAGGDVVAGDPPPGQLGWRIAVDGAGPQVTEKAQALANAAMATSGPEAQFVWIDGIRYSHVVDPRTGVALTDGWRAYVIAPAGVTADGLATALTVLDEAGRGKLLTRYPGVLAEVVR